MKRDGKTTEIGTQTGRGIVSETVNGGKKRRSASEDRMKTGAGGESAMMERTPLRSVRRMEGKREIAGRKGGMTTVASPQVMQTNLRSRLKSTKKTKAAKESG